jgi:hypothetical protein
MAKTEVAVAPENTALTTQFANDVGGGFEEADSSSYAIPFVQILQSNSPQVKKSDGAYIKGAEEGMLFNTVTNELYDGVTGVVVIPCHYTQRFIEWKLRELGGGFVKEHTASDPIVSNTTKDEKGRQITPTGTQLVDTRSHYVLIQSKDGTFSPALMAMASTQLKKSRQWMSLMQGTKVKNAEGMFEIAPMYSRKYRISTRAESNDKGSWFGYHIELAGLVEDIAEYAEAKSFHTAIRAGQAKVERKVEEETKEAF